MNYRVKIQRTFDGIVIQKVSLNRKKYTTEIPNEVAFRLGSWDWENDRPTRIAKGVTFEDIANAVITCRGDGITRFSYKGIVGWVDITTPNIPRLRPNKRHKARSVRNARLVVHGFDSGYPANGHECGEDEVCLNFSDFECTFSATTRGDYVVEERLKYPFTKKDAEQAVKDVIDEADYYHRQTDGCEDCGLGEGEWGGYLLNEDCESCEGYGIS